MAHADTAHSAPNAADSRRLAAGKLPAALLAELLAELPTQHPDLLLGPAVGEDAAVIDFDAGAGRLLVAKSDPITFATDEIGYYAVNVCVNDLAVTGATPRFYLPTLFLPADKADAATAARIFRQIGAACRGLGIAVAGGHSEITHAVTQPVVAGTLLGEVARDRYVRSGGGQVGDRLLMAGVAPVEGVSIIAREMRAVLLARGWDRQTLDAAANYLYDPGISVLAPARLAAEAGLVTAMHDPTEGGIATGIRELALAAGVGIQVDLDAIPVPELARRLCAEFGLDPLGVIASGALLATAAPQHADALLDGWRRAGWPAAVIGQIVGSEAGVTAQRSGEPVAFPHFAADEIAKLWG
jgi:hydrogenase maturation factor